MQVLGRVMARLHATSTPARAAGEHRPGPGPFHVEGVGLSQAADDQYVGARYAVGPVAMSKMATCTVLPRDGDSEVFIRFYRYDDNDALVPIDQGPLTGVVYVGFHVKVAPDERLQPIPDSVTMRIKEE